MSNQNTSRTIIVYGLPQIIDGLKSAGFTVVTGSNFMETGIAAKPILAAGPAPLVIGDDDTPGLQQWVASAIQKVGCPAVHVLMPGTPARLNLGPTPQLQAPVRAEDILFALGLEPQNLKPAFEPPALPEITPVHETQSLTPPTPTAEDFGSSWSSNPSAGQNQWSQPVNETANTQWPNTQAAGEQNYWEAAQAPQDQWSAPSEPTPTAEPWATPAAADSWETSSNPAPPVDWNAQTSPVQPQNWDALGATNQWNNAPAEHNAPAPVESSPAPGHWPATDATQDAWSTPAVPGAQEDWNTQSTQDTWSTQSQWPSAPQESWNTPAAPTSADDWNQPSAAPSMPATQSEWPAAPQENWNTPAPEAAAQNSNWNTPAPADDWNQPTAAPSMPATQSEWPAAPQENWNTPASADDWNQPTAAPSTPATQSEWPAAPQENWNTPAPEAAAPNNDWNTPSDNSWDNTGSSWNEPAPQEAPAAAPTELINAPTPLRTRKGHGYVPPSGEKVGKVITVLGGKGGIGKSTMALQLAHTLANAGYRTVLVDGNAGQPDLTAYLRIHNGMHNGMELPSIYEAATVNERAAVIDPTVLNSVRKGFEPVKFWFVAGAPAHLNDATIVNEDIYSKVISACQEEMDFVVVDLQIIEQSNRSDFVEHLVFPALKHGGYGLAITDMSSPGVNNVRYVLGRLKEEQMEMSRIGLVINRVENEQMSIVGQLEENYANTVNVKTLGTVGADPSLQAVTNAGQLELGNPQITAMIRKFLRVTVGLPEAQFPDTSTPSNNTASQPKSGGLFGRLWRK